MTEPDLNLSDGMRVGLLGGSFNPPHDGHVEISRAALRALSLDAVVWLVTPGNPQKAADLYAPYPIRLAAARDLLRRTVPDDPIVVSDFENRRRLVYSADTVAALLRTYPRVDFVWLIGADSLAGLHTWRNWRTGIAERMPIAVFGRPGAETAASRAPAARALRARRLPEIAADTLAGSDPPAWVFVSETRNPASSTEIRATTPDWTRRWKDRATL